MKRVFTALLLLPLFILAVMAHNPAYFFGLVALVSLLGALELQDLAGAGGVRRLKAAAGAWTLAVVASRIWPERVSLELVLAAGLLVLMFAAPFLKMELREVLLSISVASFGVLYLGFLLGYFILLRGLGDDVGPRLIFVMALAVFVGDSAAYYVGSAFGRHRLAPVISPKKTWEGAIANGAGGILGVAVAKATFFPAIGWTHVAALGLTLSVVGQFGDAFESLLKRGAGVKDSSNLLPGHGGILDRLDSLLFNGPVLFYYHQVFLR